MRTFFKQITLVVRNKKNNNNIMATIKNNYINYCNVSINISKYEKS